MASPALRYRFTGTNAAAQAVAKRKAARLVTRVSKETRDALRAVVGRAIREGIPPYDAARAIQSMVGMTAPQAQAAMNYRVDLVNQGLDIGRVNGLVDTYVAQKIKERSVNIARTELMGALNEGALAGWRDAQSEGLLGATATKGVIITDDEALCPVCADLEDVTVDMDKPFQTANGAFMVPPFHPQCRCAPAVYP